MEEPGDRRRERRDDAERDEGPACCEAPARRAAIGRCRRSRTAAAHVPVRRRPSRMRPTTGDEHHEAPWQDLEEAPPRGERLARRRPRSRSGASGSAGRYFRPRPPGSCWEVMIRGMDQEKPCGSDASSRSPTRATAATEAATEASPVGAPGAVDQRGHDEHAIKGDRADRERSMPPVNMVNVWQPARSRRHRRPAG